MEFWNRLEEVRKEWNVLEHPFYQRWSCGELSQEELALYSGQYRYAVQALANRSEQASQLAAGAERTELTDHAAEEASHVALWDSFMAGVGGVQAEPTKETAQCAAVWSGQGKNLPESLIGLWAIESGQPAISETKSAGLKEFYGFAPGSTTAYFDLHAKLDIEHSDFERELIVKRLDSVDQDALVAEAEAVWKANWELLDGVEQLVGSAA